MTRRNNMHNSAGALNYYHHEVAGDGHQSPTRGVARSNSLQQQPQRPASVVRSTQRNPGLVTPPSNNGRLGADLYRLLMEQQQQNHHQQRGSRPPVTLPLTDGEPMEMNHNDPNNSNHNNHSSRSGWRGRREQRGDHSRSRRSRSRSFRNDHTENEDTSQHQDHSTRSTGGIGRRRRGLRSLWGGHSNAANVAENHNNNNNNHSEHSSSDDAEVNIREVPPHERSTQSSSTTRSSIRVTRRRRSLGSSDGNNAEMLVTTTPDNKKKQGKHNKPDDRTTTQHQSTFTTTKIRQSHILQMTRRLQAQHSKRYSPHYAEILAILEFWRTVCPAEVTLKMLAFLGPQLVQKLQRTQRQIHHLLQYDVSWRVLCEELYKWKQGDPLPHGSWKDHYKFNPCVPVDFSDIGLALATVGSGWTPKQYKKFCKLSSSASVSAAPEIQQNVTVWLRPRPDEPYQVAQAIPITTLRRTTQVTIRTMIPSNRVQEEEEEAQKQQQQHHGNLPYDTELRAPEQEEHRALEECHPDSRRNAAADDDNSQSEEDDSSSEEEEEDEEENNNRNRMVVPVKASSKMALLRSNTRRRNEPMFRVMRGQLILRNVAVEHSCLGVDIWNGNAAVHIQPTYLHTAITIPMVSLIPSATAVIEDSSITSISGRGIVTVDGGQLFSKKSYIHNCAATGVYVGGRGSSAILKYCDVWQNGVGNPQMAGGISRGHSGIYVEQAKSIELDHCSVAYNTASGISMIGAPMPVAGPAVGTTMQLNMSHSNVLSNGFSPIDMPNGPAPVRWNGGNAAGPVDGPSFEQQPWQHASQQNRIAVVGVPQAESSPLVEELERQKEIKRQKDLEKRLRRKVRRQQKKAVAAARMAAQQASVEHAARALDWNATPPWNN